MSSISSKHFMTYAEAKSHIAKHNIKSFSEYAHHRKNHKDGVRLPGDARFWTEYEGATIFFNKETPEYWSYEKAKSHVRKLAISTLTDYRKYREDKTLKHRLPCAPNVTYKLTGWINTYSFFGTVPHKSKRNSGFLNYSDAKAMVREAGVESHRRFLEFRSDGDLDGILPRDPVVFYRKYGCKGADDFYLKNNFLPYREARELVREHLVKTRVDYIKFRETKELTHSLPLDLGYHYGEEYEGASVFFNKHLSYENVKRLVQEKGVDSIKGYKSLVVEMRGKLDLPTSPAQAYKNQGWIDYGEFLGNKINYLTFEEARQYVQENGIFNHKTYKAHVVEVRGVVNLPLSPNKHYLGRGWIGALDFYGQNGGYHSYTHASDLIQKLGLENYDQYLVALKSDPEEFSRFPEKPQRYYKNIGWTNFYRFLGKEVPDSFTYDECKKYLLDEMILGVDQYNSHRFDTSMTAVLPGCPEKFYEAEWEGLDKFFSRKENPGYVRYEHAQEFARSCNFSNLSRYREFIHDNDLKQYPPNPQEIYRLSGWINVRAFLKGRILDFESAKKYLKQHQISSKKTFEKFRAENKAWQLPARPDDYYRGRGWTNYYDFYGLKKPDFYSYEEAKKLARDSGLTSYNSYNAFRRDNDLTMVLPVSPSTYYVNDWVGFRAFSGVSNDPMESNEKDFPSWVKAMKKWLKNETSLNQKRSTFNGFLNNFLVHVDPQVSLSPAIMMHKDSKFPKGLYRSFISSWGRSSQKQRHSYLVAFFDWCLEEYCTDHDDETGENYGLPGYRNVLTQVEGLENYYCTKRQESNKPVLAIEYVERAKKFIFPNGNQSLNDLKHLHEDFGSVSDWLEVDQEVIDKKDPNCVWRQREITRHAKVTIYEIWSPARVIALFTLLRMPLRGQQILWLDSGEGDSMWPTLKSGKLFWSRNNSKLVNTRNGRFRGVIQPARDGSNEASLYITTNKTGRGENGYFVDWAPDDLVYWLLVLRDWQVKYNPLESLTEWKNIRLPREINQKILIARGSQAFLFRDPKCNLNSPLFTGAAFAKLLPEVLYKISREGEELAEYSSNNYSLGVRYKSKYTPHSLRVSLITALIDDGGAPIVLVSKLVGHASIVMTIYYTKINAKKIKSEIGKAEKIAIKNGQTRVRNAILQDGLETHKSTLVTKDWNLFDGLESWPKTGLHFSDRGICPLGGGGCESGGALLSKRTKNSLYSAVEPGYLGKRNCPRCRFFITGPAFIGGLVSLANELSLEIITVRSRYKGLENRLEELENLRYSCEQAETAFFKLEELTQVEVDFQASASKLDMYLCDFAATDRLVKQCLELVNLREDGKSGYDLIATDSISEVGVDFSEGASSSRLLAEIYENAEIYTSADPSRALPIFSQMLDRLADNNGIAPGMYRLSDKEKISIGNQIVKLLYARLGSWREFDKLFTGEKMLLDFEYSGGDLKPLSKEVKALFDKPALSDPKTCEAVTSIYEVESSLTNN